MGWHFSSSNDPSPESDIPDDENIDSEAWRAAEDSVRSRNGGFAGVGEHEKYRQIKEAYDQIADQNTQARKWEGTEDTGV